MGISSRLTPPPPSAPSPPAGTDTTDSPPSSPRTEDSPRTRRFIRPADFSGRLLTRLLVPYTALTLVAFSVAGWLFLRAAENSLDSSLSTRLVGHASVVAGQLRPEYLQYLTPGDESTRLYALLIHQLNGIRRAAGVDDIFIIDRQGRVLLDADQELPIGAEYLLLKMDAVELSRVWAGHSTASTLYADDGGDLYKSGYAPVFDSGGQVIAAVGVEAGADFLAVVNELRHKVLYLILAATVLAVLISVILSRSIVGPLRRLVEAFGRMMQGHGYPTVPVATRDEVGYLTHAFNAMSGRLQRKDAELTRLYELERERAERIQGLSVQVLEGISSGVIAVDLGGRVLLCNQAAADLVPVRGYPFPDSGVPPDVRQVLDSGSPVLDCLTQSLEQHREFLREDRTWTPRPGGDDQVLGISAFPLSDRDGTRFGAIAIFSDLTGVVRLQDQIRIQERLAALGELSAGIAHEIRNPLGAIRGYVELLGRKIDEPRGQKIVHNILGEVAGLNRIVTDFLAFARAPTLSLEDADPAAVVRDALSLALPPDLPANLCVNVRIAKNLPRVRMDPAQVKAALVNLLQNGATAMRDTGGELLVEVEPQGEGQSEGVVLRISDTGPGVPAGIREKIFHPFFTTRADGTGLGLPIATKVVEGHGGRMLLESPHAGGARFVVWLPCSGPPETHVDASAGTIPASSFGTTTGMPPPA